MIKASVLSEKILRQKEQLLRADAGYLREILPLLPHDLPNHALIISGIRRSGKSTLQRHLNTNKGLLLTFDQKDTIVQGNFRIEVIPVHKWLSKRLIV